VISFDIHANNRTWTTVSTDDPLTDRGAWARLLEAFQRGFQGGSETEVFVSLNVVLAELAVIREVMRVFGVKITLSDVFRQRVAQLGRDRTAREHVARGIIRDEEALRTELAQIGFKRALRRFQMRNLARITTLPHAADFSVPGSGKTTVALANYALQRHWGKVGQALVVAPISAFEAWRDEVLACFEQPPKLWIFALGARIPGDVEILVCNYHRVASDNEVIREWVALRPTQIVLDEAHRMKRGRVGVHGKAVLDLSFDAERRDILSGTPTPQGAIDLVALIEYLYPGQVRQILPTSVFVPGNALDDRALIEANGAIRTYFVRTCKSELELPPTKMRVERRPMGPLQGAIYAAIVGQYRGELSLPTKDRRDLRRLGEIVMYLLEAATNPLLLPAGSDRDDPTPFAHPPLDLTGNESIRQLIATYGRYERPWKYDYVKNAVREASQTGEKTLIWTNFVRNIRLLTADLAEYRPAVIHGGISFQSSNGNAGEINREGELHRFRTDPKCTALLANPAAAGEGVSLHHWCHHAIYLDRTFNAGHFLQSQDRIHRLGLREDVLTKFTILASEGTIDDSVDDRLRAKVQGLATLLDDPGLVRVALPDLDESLDDNDPASHDDFTVVREHVLS
jgi:SNF2 family DNA or RNA helicase